MLGVQCSMFAPRNLLHQRLSIRKGHRAHQRISFLAGIEAGVLDDDGDVGFDEAGVVGAAWDGFGGGQVVKSNVFGSARGDGGAIGANGFVVGIKNPDLEVGFLVRSVEDADAFVAGHFGLGTVAGFGDVTFGDGPAFVADGSEFFLVGWNHT